MSLFKSDRDNFEMLRKAFLQGDAVLLECQLKETLEIVPVVCAVNRDGKGGVTVVPFARMFTENPYELLNPPNPDGGFFTEDSEPPPTPEI